MKHYYWLRKRSNNSEAAPEKGAKISPPMGGVPLSSKKSHFWNESHDSPDSDSSRSVHQPRVSGDASSIDGLFSRAPNHHQPPVGRSAIPILSAKRDVAQSTNAVHVNNKMNLLMDQYSNTVKSPKYSEDSYSKASNGLSPQHVSISSEHYFRLVRQAYEHLQAAHYRASLKFSLAEWSHIHALLFYGRIQAIQKAMSYTNDAHNCTSQLNQIDLSGEIFVFEPIAVASNAIGTVEDYETGVLYIPDAIFPSQGREDQSHGPSHSRQSSIATVDVGTELSSQEVKQILNGTLYDWERSWYRVTESRRSRALQNDNTGMTRSSSELISAIRETTSYSSKARKPSQNLCTTAKSNLPTVSNLSSVKGLSERDLSLYEQQLTMSIEEARNAKDYTISAPGSGKKKIRNKHLRDSLSALQHIESAMKISIQNENASKYDKLQQDLAVNVAKSPEFSSSQNNDVLKQQSQVTPREENSDMLSLSLDLDSSFASSVSSSKISATSPSRNSETSYDDSNSSVESFDRKQADIPNAMSNEVTSESLKEPFEFLSNLHSSTQYALLPDSIDDFRREQDFENQSTECSTENPMKSTNSTDEIMSQYANFDPQDPTQDSDSSLGTILLDTASSLDDTTQDQPEHLCSTDGIITSNNKTPVGLSHSALAKPSRIRNSRLFTPFSTYSASPVLLSKSGLVNRGSTERIKQRVKIGNDSKERPSHFVQYDSEIWRDYFNFVNSLRKNKLAHFDQVKQDYRGNYSWSICVQQVSSDCLKLIMPRRSIASQDQVLALILQSNLPNQASKENWHVNMETDVDTSKLLKDYIEVAMNDQIIDME